MNNCFNCYSSLFIEKFILYSRVIPVFIYDLCLSRAIKDFKFGFKVGDFYEKIFL